MFWLVPSGSARLMLMGKTPSSSSMRAMSIGESLGSLISNSTGAPIETWSARAPTTLARSKRVSFGGPISIFSGSLVLTASLFATFLLTFRRSAVLALCRCDHVVDLQDHPGCLSGGFYDLHLHTMRLQHSLLSQVRYLAVEHVDPGPCLPLVVCGSELDHDIDRVKPCVLRKSYRDGFERVCKRKDCQLLLPRLFLGIPRSCLAISASGAPPPPTTRGSRTTSRTTHSAS